MLFTATLANRLNGSRLTVQVSAVDIDSAGDILADFASDNVDVIELRFIGN